MTQSDNSTPLNHTTHLLLRGHYARVARRLKVDPSYVSRVACGKRESAAVLAALDNELEDIARLGPTQRFEIARLAPLLEKTLQKLENQSMRAEELRWTEDVFMLQECDFCHDGLGMKSYGCRNFEYEGNKVLTEKSVNLLSGCLECSRLIDGEAWVELTERVFEEFLERNGVRRKEASAVKMRIEEIHQMFREHLVCAGHS